MYTVVHGMFKLICYDKQFLHSNQAGIAWACDRITIHIDSTIYLSTSFDRRAAIFVRASSSGICYVFPAQTEMHFLAKYCKSVYLVEEQLL